MVTVDYSRLGSSRTTFDRLSVPAFFLDEYRVLCLKISSGALRPNTVCFRARSNTGPEIFLLTPDSSVFPVTDITLQPTSIG